MKNATLFFCLLAIAAFPSIGFIYNKSDKAFVKDFSEMRVKINSYKFTGSKKMQVYSKEKVYKSFIVSISYVRRNEHEKPNKTKKKANIYFTKATYSGFSVIETSPV